MSAWSVNGTVLIACNCDWGCPCNFNARPSRGFCEGGWVWLVERGHVGDVQFDGLGVALFAKWPGAIHEGGGRAVAYVDDRADAAQTDALQRVLRGELGGPWGLFIKTYTLEPAVSTAFNVNLAQHSTQVRLGDVVDLQLQKITNPVTHAEVHPEVVLPEGLIVNRAHLAASSRFRVGEPLGYDHSGQYAAFGRFEYS